MATYEKLVKNGHKVQVESAVRDGLGKNIANNYAKQNGAYEGLRSGLADNLVAQLGTTNTESYIFRTTGGSADVMGVKKVNKIVANTVKYNQIALINQHSGSNNGITFTNNNDGSWTISGTATEDATFVIAQISEKLNHKAFLFGDFGGSSSTYYLHISTKVYSYGTGIIYTMGFTGTSNLSFSVKQGVSINKKIYPQVIYFYALGLNSISTVEEFYATDLGKIVKAGYHLPYSEGALLNTKIVGMKNVGYNAYDNENPTDFIKVVGGQNYTIEGTFTSVEVYDIRKNLIDTITTTAISLSNNASFVKVIGGNDTTCLHLTWSGSRTGFEKHKVWNYPVSFEGHGTNGIGDEKYPDGHIVRKFAIVDLGTLNWNYNSTRGRFSSDVLNPFAKSSESGIYIANMICPNYSIGSVNQVYNGVLGGGVDKCIALATGEAYFLYLNDSAYTDATVLKQALSGVYLVYELATPTTGQGQPYDEEQIVDDYGTEEFVYDSSVSIPTPVGHETFYQVNLQNFLQRVYQYVNGSPTDLAKTSDVGTKLYKHTVKITSGSDTTDLIIVSNTSTAYSDISSLQSDFTNGKIVSVSGTNNNQNANNENVLNLVMAKVSGTAMFGVALIDAQSQSVRCLALTGTLTDSVASV